MPTSTVVKVNIQLSRTPKKQVYEQIIKDLKEAEALLSPEYLNGGLKKYSSAPERVRPTSWAASALLARVYLYNEEWSNAELTSSKLISNNGLFGLEPLNDVFKKDSREAIWQLQTVYTGMNTGDGGFFILSSFGLSEYNPVYLSSFMLNAFEPGDSRAVPGNWVDKTVISGTTYYYPFKYKLSYGSTQGAEYIIGRT